MKVTLHIGAPKTGSSAIQYFLHENRRRLIKYGYYYPEHNMDSNQVSGGHAQLGKLLNQEQTEVAQQLVDQWLNEAEQAGCTLLLSGEAMYRHPQLVTSLFKQHELTVLAYFRHPLESLVSNHNQSIKRHSSTVTLSDFLYRQVGIHNRGASGQTFYEWKKILGDKLSVYPYVFERYTKGRIEYDFLERLGIAGWSLRRFKLNKAKINTRYVAEALELKRLLNGVLDSDNARENNAIDRALQRYSDERNNRSSELLVQPIQASVYEQITERYVASIQRAKEHWLDYCPDSFLVPQSVVPDKAQSATESLLLEVFQVYQFILKQQPQLLDTLRQRLAQQLQGEQREPIPYALLKLAEIMGLEFREPKPNPPLPANAMDVFLAEDSEPCDYLREVAKLLERQTQTEYACDVLKRALEIAPSKRKKKLQQLLDSYQQRLKAVQEEATQSSSQD